jgi:hypothetical protein
MVVAVAALALRLLQRAPGAGRHAVEPDERAVEGMEPGSRAAGSGTPLMVRLGREHHMGIYAFRAEIVVPAIPDLSGFDVEATDGHIGKIDEATMAEGATCLVVDTGFWIFGKKRMIPAGVVRAIDLDEKRVHVDMTKDEIKHAPDYDEDRHRTDEPAYHDEVGKYYDPWGGTPPMEGSNARPVA